MPNAFKAGTPVTYYPQGPAGATKRGVVNADHGDDTVCITIANADGSAPAVPIINNCAIYAYGDTLPATTDRMCQPMHAY
jgi:hypothetical protein